jgi:hypothetical protein
VFGKQMKFFLSFVYWSLLRIRDVYPGSEFFHPHQRNSVFLTQISDVDPRSRNPDPDLDFYPSRIPDPGAKAPDQDLTLVFVEGYCLAMYLQQLEGHAVCRAPGCAERVPCGRNTACQRCRPSTPTW